jgi:3-deoxy-7-phosphoheptulonate synthase
LLHAVKDSGHPVVWACDPMHGNTYTNTTGRKTRHFESIVAEVEGFVRAHHAEGTWPGGIHIELTGENVIECNGDEAPPLHGAQPTVDPRLNLEQALELAMLIGRKAK